MPSVTIINEALDKGFELYINNKDKQESLAYNEFLCCIVRMLVLIYGENELIDVWNSKDMNRFDVLLSKYGFNSDDVNNFKLACDKFYKAFKKQEVKAIKKKNKYFNIVQKYLIDMMVCKGNAESIDISKKIDFVSLLFTANSKDFYRKSTAVLFAYNPYEIYEYAKKQNLV